MEPKGIRVQPLGETSGVDRFELSDTDHTMPKLYVQIAEVFELPPDVDRDGIVQGLTKGLAFALGQYPVLAGGSTLGRVQRSHVGHQEGELDGGSLCQRRLGFLRKGRTAVIRILRG